MSEFRTVVDTLNCLVPGMQIATDIICGFPGKFLLNLNVYGQDHIQARLQLGHAGRFMACTTQTVYYIGRNVLKQISSPRGIIIKIPLGNGLESNIEFSPYPSTRTLLNKIGDAGPLCGQRSRLVPIDYQP